uniref:BZIP domain-containing protein n=3 Tax=Rhodosorus marinus TaxID=101924 RepID=A0A7S3EFE8_9RHOD|mmetsp:Transcript_31931/g.123880  ORF Transcript_31931/g.123880 Transcript_31931/m.123880 type:complete len:268 (+) Transcript_31931:514-1317(+)|eukprot:CAMPEP_0113961832 /NCGR_PEP_ID=MMETSP0011_2-20120614/5555_1 /TAXON_ID=101924 /ORGANISM="Rhodosorus marinus" /LENGTH=267 /DNA_ID=CAMNT_0000973571 /DNA_START=355 /DNA_END=1158 /DNA_ORIENTATION=- /assembly_acc=CAM_ASM_000156
MRDFKKNRPMALQIPSAKVEFSSVEDSDIGRVEMTDVMKTYESSAPPPLSAPGIMSNHDFEAQLRDAVNAASGISTDMSTEFGLGSVPTKVSSVPMSAREYRSKNYNDKLFEAHNDRRSAHNMYSLLSSPADSVRPELTSSRVTSPLTSPRPNAENYKELAAGRRQMRTLYRAMKMKRNSRISATNLEAISKMMAPVPDEMETVDKKAAAAIKNRQNAERARQTTKQNMMIMKSENQNLRKEVTELHAEIGYLREQINELTQLLNQS